MYINENFKRKMSITLGIFLRRKFFQTSFLPKVYHCLKKGTHQISTNEHAVQTFTQTPTQNRSDFGS